MRDKEDEINNQRQREVQINRNVNISRTGNVSHNMNVSGGTTMDIQKANRLVEINERTSYGASGMETNLSHIELMKHKDQ